MKITLLFPLFVAGLLGQIPAQQNPAGSPVPGRPEVSHPQTIVAPPNPDKEVAKLNGKPMTVADVDKLLGDLPPQVQMMIGRNPEQFLPQLLVFQELVNMAEQQGLDKQNPYRAEIAYQRMTKLAQAETERTRNTVKVTPEQEQQFYDAHKEDMFRMVKAKAIFVGFVPGPAPTAAPGAPKPPTPVAPAGVTRTEADAKTKVDDLRKQALAGADFGKLAHENSDDKTSAAKDGDYGDIMRTSPYPEAIKKAIFALKAGEISEPIRQPTGFYLIKAADVSYQPLETVRMQLRDQIVNQEYQKQMTAIQSKFQVTIEDKTYFTTRVAR